MFRRGSNKQGPVERDAKQHKELHRQVGQLQRVARQKHRRQDLVGETDAMQQAAFLLHDSGEYQDAAQMWVEILKLYNHEKGRPAQAVIYSNLGSSTRDAEDFDQAARYFEKAIAVHQDLGDVPGFVREEFNLGMLFAGRADYDQALQHLGAALAKAELLGDREWMARIHRYVGELLFISCKFAPALESFNLYSTLGEQLEAADWAIEGLCWMCQCYRWLGEYHYAIQALEDAFAAAEATGDSGLQVMVMAHIAELSFALGDIDRAREYALKARKVCELEEIPATSRILVDLTMGLVNAERGMTQKSRDYYDEAIELAQRIHHVVYEARVEYHYASLEFREAKLKEAYTRAGSALRLARATRDSLLEGHVSMLMGRIAQRRGEEDNAFSYRRKALDIAKATGVPELLYLAHHNLGRLYQRVKCGQEAETHYRAAVDQLERLAGSIRINYYAEAYFRDRNRMQLYQDLITHLIAQGKAEDARLYYERLGSPELKERLKHLVQLD